jgi:hypothetical protein
MKPETTALAEAGPRYADGSAPHTPPLPLGPFYPLEPGHNNTPALWQGGAPVPPARRLDAGGARGGRRCRGSGPVPGS